MSTDVAPTFVSTWDFDHALDEALDMDREEWPSVSIQTVRWWCEQQCRQRGIPFDVIEEPRWNERGQRIGNRSEISTTAGSIVYEVVEAMVQARDAAFGAVISRLSVAESTL